MEDLAHFIQSMSEKYGLLDADNPKPREVHDMACSEQQIQECPSSAASNSNNSNEVCGQPSSWEYLSVCIGGQPPDSKACLGSRDVLPSPVAFHSGNDSLLHVSARMIDINKEPEPESPLPTTSHVLIKEEHSGGDLLVESGSIVDLNKIVPSAEKDDFSNIVAMSDYLQSVYCSNENSCKLQPTDDETLDDPGHLQTVSRKPSETVSTEDSSSPMQKSHKENGHFYSKDLDNCRQNVVSSCRSLDIEDETVNSIFVEDFNLPRSASWEQSGSIRSKWICINKILCDSGFAPLGNSCMSPSPETIAILFDTLDDVVRNYARREKLVQELLAERDSLRQEEQRNDQLTLKLESDIETLKQKLAASEQRAELAASTSEKTFAALRKEHQRLEATHASALQRCSQLEHVGRAKERSLRKLQEKIQEAVRREQSQRSRDRELYEKLKHKVAISQKAQGEIIESNFLMRDLKPACIVGMYERQRAATEAEINQLREENSRMCKELREKENRLLSKAMSAVEADQTELDQREQDLIQQLTEIEKQLTKKISQCEELECREDSALLPLAVNHREDSKKENVNCHKPMKPDSAENNSSMLLLQRLQLDAAQERRNNQLLQEIAIKKLEYSITSSTCQTSIVDGCPNSECQKLLQDVCSKLKITDSLRITDAIDSLLKVVTAVPRMESFIDNVCEVVFHEGCMFLTRDTSECVVQTPEAIPDILKLWLQRLQYTEELQQFKDSVCTQLWERYDDQAEKHPMNCKLAAASVKDLINIERQYLLTQQSYREAQTLLKAEPQKLLHRIIGHFQMLFEIPRLEGVMAVMNSVYIQISEYHNFARALCSLLGLPKDSGANTIISTVTGVLNKVSNLY